MKNPLPKRIYRNFRRIAEYLVFGGALRERILVGLLGALHRSQQRRDWQLFTHEPPHFYNQRWNGHKFAYGSLRNPYGFTRGFLAAEVIRYNDRLLDIGCGDGFFTNTFYSHRCQHIDAFDIEPSAIRDAERQNSNSKIRFTVLDAVREPFPGTNYDVIVWDGAIGHFASIDLSSVLNKIVNSLAQDGIFVGSESLGTEGSDHLQFFESESELAVVFQPYFKNVWIKSVEYRLEDGSIRREAYWRCWQNKTDRHESTQWIDCSTT